MEYRPLYISHPDGFTLHLREWQGLPDREREKPACLLVHGFGEGSYVWSEFAGLLASHCRALAIDLRGHGDSGWDAEARYHVQTHVADVVHAIDVLRLDRFIVVGHSLGGDIAIRLAASCAKRVVGAVIVDAGPALNPEGIERIRTDFNAGLSVYRSVSDYACWLQARRPLASPELLQRLAHGALRHCQDGGFRLKSDPALGMPPRIETQARDEAVLWALLEHIECPVLAVRGMASGVLARDVAQRMVQILRDGRFGEVRIAGHAVMTDNPEGFAAVVHPFLLQLIAQMEIDAAPAISLPESAVVAKTSKLVQTTRTVLSAMTSQP